MDLGSIRVLRKWRRVAMATPGQLVRTMSEVLGISTATVGQYDRQLAEAGLRSVSGRGSGAAKMTPADAANLLIAILGGGSSIRAASQTCERYGELVVQLHDSNPRGFQQVGLSRLANMPDKHTFRDALAAAIEDAGQIDETLPGRDMFWIEIATFPPSGSINWWGERSRASLNYLVSLSDFKKNPNVFKKDKYPDLWQSRRVSLRTIHALGDLVASPRR